jgi:anti-sigma factor RsiW
MMTCRHIRKHLSTYMDNELPTEKKLQIENHLAECRKCSQLRADWEQVYFQMAQIPEPKAVPFFETRLKARLEQISAPRLPVPRFIMRTALVPAAVGFGLLIGAVLGIELNTYALAPLAAQEQSQILSGYLDTGFLDAIPQGSLTATFISLTATNE